MNAVRARPAETSEVIPGLAAADAALAHAAAAEARVLGHVAAAEAAIATAADARQRIVERLSGGEPAADADLAEVEAGRLAEARVAMLRDAHAAAAKATTQARDGVEAVLRAEAARRHRGLDEAHKTATAAWQHAAGLREQAWHRREAAERMRGLPVPLLRKWLAAGREDAA